MNTKIFNFESLCDIILELIIAKFTGSITIHFSQGGIAKIIKQFNL